LNDSNHSSNFSSTTTTNTTTNTANNNNNTATINANLSIQQEAARLQINYLHQIQAQQQQQQSMLIHQIQAQQQSSQQRSLHLNNQGDGTSPNHLLTSVLITSSLRNFIAIAPLGTQPLYYMLGIIVVMDFFCIELN